MADRIRVLIHYSKVPKLRIQVLGLLVSLPFGDYGGWLLQMKQASEREGENEEGPTLYWHRNMHVHVHVKDPVQDA
jgi:hypothetical protein